ncbi:MAG TPA: GntR family transcriptional regulator [Acidimicrobiales bacterium]|nr:GntR family transcriptional regulator [Acidimicrobiales bacterium]
MTEPLVERAAEVADATDVVFRPVRAGNAFEETVERLLSVVKLGLVQEGERLPPERELAGRLEVSRMTLREAIRALQQAGLVESRRGRHGGTFVIARPRDASAPALPRPAGAGDAGLADALVMRDILEVGAVGVAAARFAGRGREPAAERAHLEGRLRECQLAELGGYRRADSRLHLAVAEATGSPSLVAAVADARMRVNDLLEQIPLFAVNLAHSNEQHATIVEALLGGDVEGARAAMADHLEGTAALLRAFLG